MVDKNISIIYYETINLWTLHYWSFLLYPKIGCFYCFLIMKTCFVPESRVTSIIAGNFIRNPFSPLFHPWAKEAGLLSRCLRIIAIMRLWLRLRRESGDTRPRAPDWGESSVMPATWGDHHGAVTQYNAGGERQSIRLDINICRVRDV